MVTLKDTIEQAASALIFTSETNLGFEVNMPVLYPNGKTVSVIVTEIENSFHVHDAGTGIMHLLSDGSRISKQLNDRIEELAAAYNCDLINGRVQTSCIAEQLPVAIAFVANVSKGISEEVNKRNQVVSLRERVTQKISEIAGRRSRTNEEVFGQSGKKYKVSNVILDAAEKRPIAYIEAVPSTDSIARRFMEFSDIAAANDEIRREAVYDDKRNWEPEDLNLLSTVSDTIPFSRSSDLFTQMVSA